MREAIPFAPWMFFSFVGPRAYVKYAGRLRSAKVSEHPVAA